MKSLQIVLASVAPFCMTFALANAGMPWLPAVAALLTAAAFVKSGASLGGAADKVAPTAAIAFLIGALLKYPLSQSLFLNLFAYAIIAFRALCVLPETPMARARPLTFVFIIALCAALSYGLSTTVKPVLLYETSLCAALFCRRGTVKETASDVWKDIAFPAAVVLFSVGLSVVARKTGAYNGQIAHMCVAVAVGAFISQSAKSPLRLALMTAAMIVVAKYV